MKTDMFNAHAISDTSVAQSTAMAKSGTAATNSSKSDASTATSGSSGSSRSGSASGGSGGTAATSSKTATTTTTQKTASQSATPQPAAAVGGFASPRGYGLYVNPSLAADGRPAQITSQPTASWFGGWSGDVRSAVSQIVSAASAQGKLATLVAYNIPGRDCGSYSAGGSSSADAYRSWIRQFAAGVGGRKAIVILEPDALAQIDCLSTTDQNSRYSLLSDAVTVFATQTNAFIYLDAGHSGWISAATMASRLQSANVSQARGFSLNVSNFETTANNTSYGNQIAGRIGKSYVIDTGRNGNGSNGDWCNPTGRKLGNAPTTNVGGNTDAYLWVKVPGESDGTCNGGPAAGVWWNDYAVSLL